MRKQESIHLHALLVVVANRLDERPDAPSPDLATYREREVGPSAVHCSKEDHEAALLALSAALDRSIAGQAAAGAGPG